MATTRAFVPITLYLDTETVDLLIDAIRDHVLRVQADTKGSLSELGYVSKQARRLLEELLITHEGLQGVAPSAATRQHVVPGGHTVSPAPQSPRKGVSSYEQHR